jgi:glycosylphosphatidylinositol phospholipase D
VDFLAAGGVLNSETIALTITPGGSMFFGDRPAGSGTLNLSGANGSSGQQLATQLDMDGDGISEILFGDPNPSSGTGSASLLFPALVSGVELNDPAWSLNVSGNSAGDLTGLGLGGGDLDGDGYDELLIGAPGTDTGASGSGVWALFSGAAPGAAVPLTEANALLTTSIAGAGMGFGRPIVADLDGSGAMDLAMGSFGANQVWFLSDPGLLSGVVDLDASAQILSGTGNFGFALSSGDTNLDGSLELIIGAPSVGGAAADPAWDSVPGVGTGMVWIVPGISLEGDVSGLAEASVFGAQEGDLFGSSLSVGADATGDAQDDLAIGAPRYGSGLSGRVWIYRGPPPE